MINLNMRQGQNRRITKCQVCLKKLKHPSEQFHLYAMVTCGDDKCNEYALKYWLAKPSGVIDDE